jgi:hypothetical protein
MRARAFIFAVPTWISMLRRTALGGDDEIALTGPAISRTAVEQREQEFLARLAALGDQQQRRNGQFRHVGQRDLVHVAVAAAAQEIAVDMILHPLRKIGGDIGLGH